MGAEFFLAALDLEGKEVLVTGAEEEALARCDVLVSHGAVLTVVAPAFSAAQRAWFSAHPSVQSFEREPEAGDVDGKWLVVQADQNETWSELLGQRARELRVFFCAIDQPTHNTFAHVGIARAGALQLGISTSGKVPGIAGSLKRLLQKLLDESDFASVVAELEKIRKEAPREGRGKLLRALASQIRLDGRLWLEPRDEEKP